MAATRLPVGCQGKDPFTAGRARQVAADMNRRRRQQQRQNTVLDQGPVVSYKCQPKTGGCGHHHVGHAPPKQPRTRPPRAVQFRMALAEELRHS